MPENAHAVADGPVVPSLSAATHGGRARLGRHAHAAGVALAVLAFAVAPVVTTAYVLRSSQTDSVLAFDFHYAYTSGAEAVLAGESPYTSPDDPALADGSKYVYPPLTAYLVAPFTLVPAGLGDWVFTAALIASVVGALRLLGVRDWRVYGAVFLWPPVQVGIHNANVSLLLVLGLALAWRLRASPVRAGAAVGAVAALKLFLWPLVLWTWAARGHRAGAVAGLATSLLVLAPWALIGFAGLADYPSLVRALEGELAARSYSLYALVLDLGAPTTAARAASFGAAFCVIAAGIVVGRRGDDRRSFVLMIAGALLATPLLWVHYLCVLVVVLALARPLLSPIWLAPAALWGLPMVHFLESTTGEAALVLGVAAVVLGTSLRAPPPPDRPPETARGGWRLIVSGIALVAAGLAVPGLPSGMLVVGVLLLVLAAHRPPPNLRPAFRAGPAWES